MWVVKNYEKCGEVLLRTNCGDPCGGIGWHHSDLMHCGAFDGGTTCALPAHIHAGFSRDHSPETNYPKGKYEALEGIQVPEDPVPRVVNCGYVLCTCTEPSHFPATKYGPRLIRTATGLPDVCGRMRTPPRGPGALGVCLGHAGTGSGRTRHQQAVTADTEKTHAVDLYAVVQLQRAADAPPWVRLA